MVAGITINSSEAAFVFVFSHYAYNGKVERVCVFAATYAYIPLLYQQTGSALVTTMHRYENAEHGE